MKIWKSILQRKNIVKKVIYVLNIHCFLLIVLNYNLVFKLKIIDFILMESLKRLAENYAQRINFSPAEGVDRYVVVKGRESVQRHIFVRELSSLVNIFVYGEEQFPNSKGKMVIDLDKPDLRI
jgi:hypothetical protein